jgi:uncharacterized membrane protein
MFVKRNLIRPNVEFKFGKFVILLFIFKYTDTHHTAQNIALKPLLCSQCESIRKVLLVSTHRCTCMYMYMCIPNCCFFKSATLSRGGELLLTVVPVGETREDWITDEKKKEEKRS